MNSTHPPPPPPPTTSPDLVGRSPTFAYWRKVGLCGLLSHIAHIRYQMGTNPGIHVGEGRATPNYEDNLFPPSPLCKPLYTIARPYTVAQCTNSRANVEQAYDLKYTLIYIYMYTYRFST